MSKAIPEEVRYQALLQLARKYYKDYLLLSHHNSYTHFKHTKLIADELQKIADGEQRYIIIEMPPRHGKSMTVSETFPSYYLAKNPNKRVITTAYSDGLARKFGRANRNKFAEFSNQLFDVDIAYDNGSVNDWSVHQKSGGMISTGIGGSITGQGADLMIIDDPHKNAKEAASKTMRDFVWDEWESTLSTRLHQGASVIVIMTRWNEDDFVGRLIKQDPDKWVRLRLPAIAEEEGDLIGREIGQALCAELGYDEEWAKAKKKEVGSRTWASLYQQRPSPASGNIFKRDWFKYYKTAPHRYDRIVTSWDFTFKDTDSSDFVVGQVWQKSGADYYLLDQVRGRLSFTESVRAVKQLQAKYPQCRTILIEDKANGPAIINTLKKELSGIVPITPKDSKVGRANAVTPFFEAGNVYIKEDAAYVGDLIEEFVVFPNGANDDQCDSATQALNYFAEQPTSSVIGASAW